MPSTGCMLANVGSLNANDGIVKHGFLKVHLELLLAGLVLSNSTRR